MGLERWLKIAVDLNISHSEIEVDSTAIISLVTNDAITNNLLGILKAKLGSSHGSILNTDLVAVFVEPPEAVVSFL